MKKQINYLLFISVIVICVFGIIMIYSSSHIWSLYKYGDSYKFLRHQSIFFLIGLALMYFMSKVDYNLYYKKANLIIIVSIALLMLVLIPGIGTVRNGSRSWFGIGTLGIQPSEAAKIGLIIFTSKYLVKHKNILPIMLFTLFIFGLIMLQPDFGTGFVIVMSIMGLLFIGGMDISFIIKISIIGIAGIIGLIVVAPYRLQRILSFLNPWSDPLGSGFQIIQSLYAIGPGRLLRLR